MLEAVQEWADLVAVDLTFEPGQVERAQTYSQNGPGNRAALNPNRVLKSTVQLTCGTNIFS